VGVILRLEHYMDSTTVAFTIKVNDHLIPIKLPARVEKAQAVLKKQWDEGAISHKRGKENTYGYEQAYRVAWRNILVLTLTDLFGGEQRKGLTAAA
jgi:hypothetical protein